MAGIDDILKNKLERLNSVPEDFINSVAGSENEIIAQISEIVAQLDRENGVFLLNEKNLRLIDSIDQRLKDAVFNDEYVQSLTEFTKQFNAQAKLNNSYFTELLGNGFENSKLYELTLLSSQKNALAVLGEDAFGTQLIGPIKQIIQSSITNGASFTDILKNLNTLVKGDPDQEIDGKFVGYIKRYAKDAFTSGDANYTNVIANDLGLEFGRWMGPKLEDTRDFCKERIGKYFHRKEVEQWGSGNKCCGLSWPDSKGNWQGRNSATDKNTIFVLRGGYNCNHNFVPVSTKQVPKEVINRAVSSGYYKIKAAS